MKITKQSQLKHGMRVKCRIKRILADDARISIDECGDVFICQNVRDGVNTDDKLGYEYAWNITDNYGDLDLDGISIKVTDLESVEGLRAMKVGDIIIDEEGDEATVLAVLGRAFLKSFWGDHNSAGSWWTFKRAERLGWKLKGQEDSDDDITELSMDEIADKFDVDVKKLKIKKE